MGGGGGGNEHQQLHPKKYIKDTEVMIFLIDSDTINI